MSIHEGHRQRLRRRYLEHGAAGMNEHELLELILTYAIPRKDVNPLAHELINKYGSLKAVLCEDAEEQMTNRGISQNSAALFRLLAEAITGRLLNRDPYAGRKLPNVREAMLLCMELLMDKEHESACVVLLDAKSTVRECYFVPGGDLSVEFSLKRMVAFANARGASSVMIAHTHPSGKAEVSAADAELSAKLKSVLDHIGISFVEHVIVTDRDCVALFHDVRLSDLGIDADEIRSRRLIG